VDTRAGLDALKKNLAHTGNRSPAQPVAIQTGLSRLPMFRKEMLKRKHILCVFYLMLFFKNWLTKREMDVTIGPLGSVSYPD
jgi:hypothetical protein